MADDGIAEWDVRGFERNQCMDWAIKEVFESKYVVGANQSFREEWDKHLRCNKDKLKGALATCETAIWSTDSFYPLLLRPDFFAHLAQGYVIQFERNPRTRIRKIERANNDNEWPRLIGWDMECAALFSVGVAFNLEVAASLVVSYSSKHCCDIGNYGKPDRSDEEKAMAHAIEHALIVEAIRYLFDRT